MDMSSMMGGMPGMDGPDSDDDDDGASSPFLLFFVGSRDIFLYVKGRMVGVYPSAHRGGARRAMGLKKRQCVRSVRRPETLQYRARQCNG